MKTPTLEYLNHQLKKLVEFIDPFLPLTNSHLVQFIMEDQWNTLLCPNIRRDLMKLEYDDLRLIPTAELHAPSPDLRFEDLDPSVSLQDFILALGFLKAEKLDILAPTHLSLGTSKMEDDLGKVMSAKKAHEVSRMSNVIADACKAKKIDWVVDIGSGLGYLSSVLLVHHDINVLALDSSSSNISNTLKRCRVIKNMRPVSEGVDVPFNNQVRKSRPLANSSPNIRNEENMSVQQGNAYLSSFSAFNGKFIGLTKFLTNNENLSELLFSCQNERCNAGVPTDIGLIGLHTCGNLATTSLKLYVSNPSVKLLCNVGCCYNLLEEEFAEDFYYIKKYVKPRDLNGCEKIPRLDSRYHSPDLDPLHQKGAGTMEAGFPLCSHLQKIKFAFGRNTRDLASKPPHRLSATKQNLKTLFWRALFQVIVVDSIGSWPENTSVGRKPAKSSSQFIDYCRKCFQNIGIDSRLTDQEINEYYRKYRSKEDELLRFYFLKASVGSVIETIINLDRLIYLLEHGFHESFLVQMFDRVISPRSLAVLSFK